MDTNDSTLTLAQAAQLVGRHERIIRRRIYRGELPATKDAHGWHISVQALEHVDGWHVDPARLAQLQRNVQRPVAGEASVSTLATIAALQRTVETLSARVRALEARQVSAPRENVLAALPLPERPESQHSAPSDVLPLPPAAFSLRYTEPAAAATFRTHADAARWLLRHGIESPGTPKYWPGWREVELTPAAVLAFALGLRQEADRTHNHRVIWRLHRCEDSGCICHELLA